MSPRLLVVAAIAGLSLGCPTITLGQHGKAGMASTADAGKLLDQAREAIGKLTAMSYHATVEGAGALAGKVPTVAADVSMAKAEAGGWKIYAKGSSSGADSGAVPFEVAY